MLAVAPTIPHHCSDDFLIACRDLAREYEVGIHSHVAGSRSGGAGYGRYGTSLAGHLDELGLVNERFTVAHGVWLDDEDMKWLGDRGLRWRTIPAPTCGWSIGMADMRGMLTGRSMSASAPTAPTARTTKTCTRRCGWPRSLQVQGPDVQRWLTTGEVLRAPEGSARRWDWKSRSENRTPATRPTSSFSTCTTSTGSRPTIL
jgi:guanine deaminase